MTMRINLKYVLSTFLTYFVILMNQTHISVMLSKYEGVLLLFFAGMLFLKSRRILFWCLVCIFPLLLIMLYLRYSIGGIGANSIISLANSIIACGYMVAFNKKRTLEIYLKVTTFLALVSVILWAFCLFFPNVWRIISPQFDTLMKYRVYSSSTFFTEYSYHVNGLFLYSMRQVDFQRNTGIFTEPGVYQMMLNSALYIAIFMRDKLTNLSNDRIRNYIVIIIITLITTQSTTGYIGGFIILLFGIISKSIKFKRLKKSILLISICIIVLLTFDYIKRGSDSLFTVTIIGKLFSESGKMSVITSSSGGARWGAILLSIQSIIRNPLGVGFDNFNSLLNTQSTGYVAASVLTFGAIWGVFALLYVLWWIISPIVNSNSSTSTKWLFVLLYFNTTLAQTSIFYPTLIFIPISLFYLRYSRIMAIPQWNDVEHKTIGLKY